MLRRRACPAAIGDAVPGRSISSSSTSGISTSSTTSLFVQRPSRSATASGRHGDGKIIDGLGPDGVAARPHSAAERQPAADRLRLPLCLRHADRRRRLLSWYPCRVTRLRAAHADWPASSASSPSCRLSASLLILCVVARAPTKAVARNARWIALGPRWRPSPVDPAVDRFRPRRPRFPVRREGDLLWFAGFTITTGWASTASRCSSSCFRAS